MNVIFRASRVPNLAIPAIDSHHHLWSYGPEAYPWIGPHLNVLRNDFLPGHLAAEIAAAGVDGTVAVQARQSLEETAWLLDLASAHPFIRGVVGWVPLCSPELRPALERFCANPKLKGVRHVVQDEPDDDFLLRPAFQQGIAQLREFDVVYDILIFERHLSRAIRLVDAHPHQTFVLDHIGKPGIRGEAPFAPWKNAIQDLARRPNVYCKLSGMATEADWQSWTADQLRPYFDTVLEAFTPQRLMFGSDWPVLLLASGYSQWLSIVREWISALSEAEQCGILRDTAVSAYRL